MENIPLVIGIDLGTSSVKVAIVTCEVCPTIVTQTSRKFGNTTVTGPSAFGNLWNQKESEQDVSKIFHCLHMLLGRIPKEILSRVVRIAITGQMHGVVGWTSQRLAFDTKKKVDKQRLEISVNSHGCSCLTTWLDRRCDDTFLNTLPKSNNSERPDSGFGCATILWHFKNETDEFSLKAVSQEDEIALIDRIAMLRKISTGSRFNKTVVGCSQGTFVNQQNLIENTLNAPICRSVSQITPPCLEKLSLLTMQHPPWTCCGTIADFLVAELIGISKPVMSPQMATSWGYFDIKNNCWDKPILELAGFPLHLLPNICECGTVVGKLTFNWEGIPEGVDVLVASGDLQCSVYSYIKNEGNAACNLSTSAQIAFKLPFSLNHLQHKSSRENFNPSESHENETKFVDFLKQKRITTWPLFERNETVVVATSLNGGNVIDRFVKMLRSWVRQLGGAAMDDEQVYSRLIQLLPESQFSDPTDIMFCPRLFGERFAPNDQASVLQISSENLGLGHVYYTMCKGIVENLTNMAPEEILKYANIEKVICIGGAVKRNPTIKDAIMKQYPNLQCVSAATENEASVGVALYAVSLLKLT